MKKYLLFFYFVTTISLAASQSITEEPNHDIIYFDPESKIVTLQEKILNLFNEWLDNPDPKTLPLLQKDMEETCINCFNLHKFLMLEYCHAPLHHVLPFDLINSFVKTTEFQTECIQKLLNGMWDNYVNIVFKHIDPTDTQTNTKIHDSRITDTHNSNPFPNKQCGAHPCYCSIVDRIKNNTQQNSQQDIKKFKKNVIDLFAQELQTFLEKFNTFLTVTRKSYQTTYLECIRLFLNKDKDLNTQEHDSQ